MFDDIVYRFSIHHSYYPLSSESILMYLDGTLTILDPDLLASSKAASTIVGLHSLSFNKNASS
jgi:hypothetical protein